MLKGAAVLALVAISFGCAEADKKQSTPSASVPAASPASAAAAQPAKKKAPVIKTAEGVLKHYPSHVRSKYAWYGYVWMVGTSPVIATDNVTKEMLKRHIGKKVRVKGPYHPGTLWKKDPADMGQMPVSEEEARKGVRRGDGIKATSIELVD